MIWFVRIGVVLVVLLIGGAAALYVYATGLRPEQGTQEIVLPDDRFPS